MHASVEGAGACGKSPVATLQTQVVAPVALHWLQLSRTSCRAAACHPSLQANTAFTMVNLATAVGSASTILEW